MKPCIDVLSSLFYCYKNSSCPRRLWRREQVKQQWNLQGTEESLRQLMSGSGEFPSRLTP